MSGYFPNHLSGGVGPIGGPYRRRPAYRWRELLIITFPPSERLSDPLTDSAERTYLPDPE